MSAVITLRAVPARKLPARAFAIAAVLLVAFGVIPLIGSEYLFDAILTPFLALSLAALGLNILTGYAGQISLGTSAFMAVGAYAAYNLILRLPGIPLLVNLVFAGLMTAGVGLLFGLPSLRLRGFYLAVTTLAAQFFVPWALNKFGWFSNNDASGVISAPRLIVGPWIFDDARGRYLFSVSIVTAATLFAWRLVGSSTGRNFRHSGVAHETDRVRLLLLHHRPCRRAVGVRLSAHRGTQRL
jgi:branched-chain amino acid transport system permease protein